MKRSSASLCNHVEASPGEDSIGSDLIADHPKFSGLVANRGRMPGFKILPDLRETRDSGIRPAKRRSGKGSANRGSDGSETLAAAGLE